MSAYSALFQTYLDSFDDSMTVVLLNMAGNLGPSANRLNSLLIAEV